MLNPKFYENARADGFSVLEVVSEDARSARRFVPLQRTELSGELCGPLGAFRLTQTFRYRREECAQVLEAVYRFPLPGDAAVTGVSARFGDVEVRAVLKEREAAQATYDTAKAQGRQAALLTRESPDVFTLSVAGLKPDEDVEIETRYVQLARDGSDGYSLRVPLTTAPRYVREDEVGGRFASGQPLAVLRDPGHRFALDLRLRGAGKVSSPTHALSVERDEDDGKLVRLRDGEAVPDRDFVLLWRADTEESERPALSVWTNRDGDEEYFLALLAPPSEFVRGRGASREAILLVDHSGSMQGTKWKAADWAVERFLSDLTVRDRFGLALFHSETRWFARKTLLATPEITRRAIHFLKQFQDSGGTELGVALEGALSLPDGLPDAEAIGDGAGRSQHVLILTDAEVSDGGRLLRLLENRGRRRVSLLCIDAAPNSFLAHEIAERGGGVAKFLSSNPNDADMTTALDEILRDWSEPVAAGVRLQFDRTPVEAAGRETLAGGSAIDLGDLPSGRAVWVCGRMPAGAQGVAVRAVDANGREIASAWAQQPGDAVGDALKALFGARRVLELEFLLHSHRKPAEVNGRLAQMGFPLALTAATVYAENAQSSVRDAVKKALVQEALRYGLASSETAFVAVREEKGQPVEGTVAVANALPDGWSSGFEERAYCLNSSLAGAPMAPFPMAPPSPSAPPSGGVARRKGLASNKSSAEMLSGLKPVDDSSAHLVDEGIGSVDFMEWGPPAAPPSWADNAGSTAALYAGVPELLGGEEVVLFESSEDPDALRILSANGLLSQLLVAVYGCESDPVPQDAELLLFVDDLAVPGVRVNLSDVLKQNGERPLNMVVHSRSQIRLILRSPHGWPNGCTLEVRAG